MSGTLLTPPGLLGSTQPAAQPGAGLGQLYNAVNGQMQGGGIWGNQGMSVIPTSQPMTAAGQMWNPSPGAYWSAAPGTVWNGPGGQTTAPPAAPMPTYDQWGRIQGAGSAPAAPAATPNLNTGPGLPAAQGASGGYGSSGYDMWGRQAPPAAQQAPQSNAQQGPSIAQLAQQEASGIDPRTMAMLQTFGPGMLALSQATGAPFAGSNLAAALAGGMQPSSLGLLGNAVAGEGGGAGGDRGPSQGNQGQQDAATAAGGMAASGDKGPSAGGGSAASGHDTDEEGPF